MAHLGNCLPSGKAVVVKMALPSAKGYINNLFIFFGEKDHAVMLIDNVFFSE